MSNVINFTRARKAKARADKAQQADANRAKFGRTKAQKHADGQEQLRRDNVLDGVKLDKGRPLSTNGDD